MNRFFQFFHYSFILMTLVVILPLRAENRLSAATVPQQDGLVLLSGFDSLPKQTHQRSLQTTIAFNHTANAARFDQAVYDALQKVQYAGLGDRANQYLIRAFHDPQSPLFDLLTFIDNTGGKRVGGDSAWLKLYFGNINTNFTMFCFDKPSPCATNSQGNPRPFQVSQDIHLDPRYGFSDSSNSAAFPSGHSTDGNTQSLLLAVMAPERYQEILARATDYQNSRLVLGVHYALDVIGGRILATEEVIKLLNNTTGYLKEGGDFEKAIVDGSRKLHAYIQVQCGFPLAQCGMESPNTYSDYRKNKLDYNYALTYGLAPVSRVDLAPIVPQGAEVLIASRFPYLSASERREILATTELPSGYPLDNGTGYARLNLFAAADGYGAFRRNISVLMDASLGGFHATEYWRNDISGSGGLTLSGNGSLTLTGANTYTGMTVIRGGTLAVSGSITGYSVVKAGGTITGSGVLGHVAVGSGATLAPGSKDQPGAIRLQNLEIAKGSTLRVRVSSTSHDEIKAMGKVVILGGRVDLTVDPVRCSSKSRYRIVSGAKLQGRFLEVTSNLLYTPKLSYDARHVYISLRGCQQRQPGYID